MKAKALYSNLKEVNFDIKELGFSKESKLRISKDLVYEVYALSIFEGNIFFQVIDDIQYPSWMPAKFFELNDGSIPEDWICNITNAEPSLIIGPKFLASDIDSYNNMVQLEQKEMESFWKRIGRIQQT